MKQTQIDTLWHKPEKWHPVQGRMAWTGPLYFVSVTLKVNSSNIEFVFRLAGNFCTGILADSIEGSHREPNANRTNGGKNDTPFKDGELQKPYPINIWEYPPPAMLRDHASVKPSTVEPQHHNTHNHKVYTPHQNLRFIKITQRNTNFHKTKSTVFLRRTDASNNVRFCKTFWNKNERYLKSNDISTTPCIASFRSKTNWCL